MLAQLIIRQLGHKKNALIAVISAILIVYIVFSSRLIDSGRHFPDPLLVEGTLDPIEGEVGPPPIARKSAP